MRAASERAIDGWRYRVTPVGARVGQRILRRLLSSVHSLAPAIQATIRAGETDPSLVGAGALASLVGSLSDDDLDYITSELARSTQVSRDGAQWETLSEVYDLHFSGRYSALMTWAIYAVKVNYPDFFPDSPPSDAGAEAGEAPRSPSPTTSSGGSGAP